MRSPLRSRTPASRATRTATVALAALLLTSPLACDGSSGTATGGGRVRGTGPSETDSGGGTAAPGTGGGDAAGEGARSVSVRDERSQRSTSGRGVPRFVEIEGASIDGDADSLRLSVELAGPVPELMPDEVTTMRVTFTVVTRGGDRYEFFAHCTRNGWSLFASGREDAEQPFTEAAALKGNALTMTVDRSYLGPPAPFKWTANIAWTRRAERGEAYAFDLVPSRGYADFP